MRALKENDFRIEMTVHTSLFTNISCYPWLYLLCIEVILSTTTMEILRTYHGMIYYLGQASFHAEHSNKNIGKYK